MGRAPPEPPNPATMTASGLSNQLVPGVTELTKSPAHPPRPPPEFVRQHILPPVDPQAPPPTDSLLLSQRDVFNIIPR